MREEDFLLRGEEVVVREEDFFLREEEVVVREEDFFLHEEKVFLHGEEVLLHENEVLPREEDFFKSAKSLADGARAALKSLRKEKLAALIDPRRSHVASEIALVSPARFLRPSRLAAVTDTAKTVSVYVLDGSLTRYSIFNTHEDHSWIANSTGVVRQKFGAKLDEVDPTGDRFPWQ